VISESAEGTQIRLKVVPGAKKNQVAGEHGGRLRVRIQAPPVEGKANRELIGYFSRVFGLRKNRIIILRGEGSREKTVLLAGLPVNQARLKLETLKSEE
jgi:uncharacterized protein (TIGR00251 family)